MADSRIADLIKVKMFPPVVHSGHAFELMASQREDELENWLGGYIITTPEQRQLLDDIFSTLAWKMNGRAWLINGLYGTGKSHLLLVLHLLAGLSAAWEPFLTSHPTYRRFSLPIQKRNFLLVHFSLDEYAPAVSLEQALHFETDKALKQAGVSPPDQWQNALSRADAWRALLSYCREAGHDGLLLLIDEMSLFLAAKSAERREEDAAFLQFLAEMASRYPIWLLGTTQRNLSDSGALATHSWRQVEDRFQRYSLPIQSIGQMISERLIARSDPAAIRLLINEQLMPQISRLKLPFTSNELHLHWPFHPQAIALICAAANNYLSPHRSLVALLQRLANNELIELPATRLLTALDLYCLVVDDLLTNERLQTLWKAVNSLAQCAKQLPNVALSSKVIALLAIAWLGERSLTVEELHSMLFDGETAPEIEQISLILHSLRRRVAYLQVIRHHEQEAEIFTLVLDDIDGVTALSMMEEKLREYATHDPRVFDTSLQACQQTPFLLRLLAGNNVRQAINWAGAERNIEMFFATPTNEMLVNAVEAIRSYKVNGVLFLLSPGDEFPVVPANMAEIPSQLSDAIRCWQSVLATEHDWALWQEYAAWLNTADEQVDNARGRRIRQRCRERADELRSAVADSITHCYLRGNWWSLAGNYGSLSRHDSMEEALTDIFVAPFSRLFPYCQAIYQQGEVTQNACRLLQEHFITPGRVRIDSPLLPMDYIERILMPLHCARMQGEMAIVTPPATDLLAPLLAQAAIKPLSVSEALKLLSRVPAGLPASVGILVLGCAIKSGVLCGLDAFLQPLLPASLESDNIAFVEVTAVPDDQTRERLNGLADYLQINEEEWPLRGVLLEYALREKAREIVQQASQVEAVLCDWNTTLHCMPWAFRHTSELLEQMKDFSQIETSLLTTSHALSGDNAVNILEEWEELFKVSIWWREFCLRVLLVTNGILPAELRADANNCSRQLANGEESFNNLAEIGNMLLTIHDQFRNSYLIWHDSIFGTKAISRLRNIFDSAEFRVLKIFVTFPLPVPNEAMFAIQALTQARNNYCPGNEVDEAHGYCPRCRLLYATENPMPALDVLRTKIDQALMNYLELLAVDQWSIQCRERIKSAPVAIARSAEILFNWQRNDDTAQLLQALQEPLPGWLCRTERSRGSRRCVDFQEIVSGRELTKYEAHQSFQSWLDPDGVLTDDSVLSFE